MLKVLSNILCDLDPKVKVIGQKAGICDGVPSTSALVYIIIRVCIKNIFCYISTKTYVVGTQKNGLNETVLFSIQNIYEN